MRPESLARTHGSENAGQFVGRIAHDVNNLLTSVVGYSELVLKQVTPGTQLADDAKEIYDAGQAAAVLIRQLLAFSGPYLIQPSVPGSAAGETTVDRTVRDDPHHA
jgi:signal transduction histidine kinase